MQATVTTGRVKARRHALNEEAAGHVDADAAEQNPDGADHLCTSAHERHEERARHHHGGRHIQEAHGPRQGARQPSGQRPENGHRRHEEGGVGELVALVADHVRDFGLDAVTRVKPVAEELRADVGP